MSTHQLPSPNAIATLARTLEAFIGMTATGQYAYMLHIVPVGAPDQPTVIFGNLDLASQVNVLEQALEETRRRAALETSPVEPTTSEAGRA